MKIKKILAVLLICVAFFACAITASAEDLTGFTGWNGEFSENGYYEFYYYKDGVKQFNTWIIDEGEYYYIGADGLRYEDGVYQIGSYLYYFDYNGVCAIDEVVECYSSETETWDFYYAQPVSGRLLINGWHQSFKDSGWDTEDWAYYGADGKAYKDGAYIIGGTYYYFDGNCRMADNEDYSCYDSEEDRWYYYRAKSGGALYVNEWYEETHEYASSSYYYYGADGRSAYGYNVIGGTPHLFSESGCMLTDVTEQFDGVWYYADGNGYATKFVQGWNQINDGWYFVNGEELYKDGVYAIGSYFYGFDWSGRMYADTTFSDYDYEAGENYYYRAKADGTLWVNSWYEEVYDEINSDWYYYGAGGKAAKGYTVIGGVPYLFSDDGWKMVNTTREDDGIWYVADENGYAKQLVQGWNAVGDYWYFLNNGELYSGGIYTIGGNLYGFAWDGRMYADEVFYFYDNVAGREYCYRAKADGTIYVNQWYERKYDGGSSWFYYGEGGKAAYGYTVIGGKAYLFDWEGEMQVNTTREYDGAWYVADNSGYVTKLVQGWNEVGGYWYFVNAGELYRDDIYTIGGKLYGFDWAGRMYADQSFDIYTYDENAQEGLWIYYRAKADGTLWVNTWYQRVYEYGDSDWYYYGEGGKAAKGYTIIGGKPYLFSHDGRMITGEAMEDDGAWYVADENGYATKLVDGWNAVNGEWYFVNGEELYRDGIYTIGGKLYGFNWEGRMHADQFFWMSYYDEFGNWQGEEKYYAKASGILAQNEWIQNGDVWYCFDSQGRAYIDTIVKIGSYTYYFDSWGEAAQNTVVEADGKVYLADNDCRLTEKNGWFLAPSSMGYGGERYMCALNGELLRSGIYQIGGEYWGFNYEGVLYDDQMFEIHEWDEETESETYKYYIATKGGALAKPGWVTCEGNHYIVTADRSLYEGWYQNTYYMNPAMEYCSIIRDDNKLYAMNSKGTWKAITTDGFYSTLQRGTYYVKNGSVVAENWVKHGNYWYYFDIDGQMLVDGSYEINGKRYFFLSSGRMADFGWVRDSIGNWYWAASSGVLYTGKDSAGYAFNEYGRLVVNNTVCIDDVWYVTNGDGKVVHNFNTFGWKQVGNDWYLAQDGEPVYGFWTDSQDRTYYFDGNGKMRSNCFINDRDYYAGADGILKTGWFVVNNQWYYGQKPTESGLGISGYLCGWGEYTIGGKTYLFKQAVLQQNAVNLNFDGYYYNTDSEGIVTKRAKANGWSYWVNNSGAGIVYYYKNGEAFTGWVGDYYIDHGEMCVRDTIEWNNERYYLGANGKYARNGWLQPWENDMDWYYANADGTLCCDEWKQFGSKWYYFDGCYMAWGGAYYIDGEWYEFDENGVYLGKATIENDNNNGKNDGWVWLDGEWYFSMAGEYVGARELYIDGSWYYFEDDGVMTTDYFRVIWSMGNETPLYYYYGNDGKRVNYTGWVKINNRWVFFNADHTIPTGIFYDGSNYYYQEMVYELNDEMLDYADRYVCMQTGYHVIHHKLYHFNASGILDKTITANGWFDAGGIWYYIENGECLIDEEKLIGNKWYAFDSSGIMVFERTYGDYYYDKSGARVMTAGWYQMNDGRWIYVYKNGVFAWNGIHLIGGKEYVFDRGRWVA